MRRSFRPSGSIPKNVFNRIASRETFVKAFKTGQFKEVCFHECIQQLTCGGQKFSKFRLQVGSHLDRFCVCLCLYELPLADNSAFASTITTRSPDVLTG